MVSQFIAQITQVFGHIAMFSELIGVLTPNRVVFSDILQLNTTYHRFRSKEVKNE
jgi:hypothetical protein